MRNYIIKHYYIFITILNYMFSSKLLSLSDLQKVYVIYPDIQDYIERDREINR